MQLYSSGESRNRFCDGPGVAESAGPPGTATLVVPGDVSALAEYLRSLAGDPALAQQMGQRGLARVRQSFTVQRMARETAALYEHLRRSDRA